MTTMLRRFRNTVLKTAAAGTVLVGTVEVTTRLPSEGRSSRFYHSLCDDWATPMMRRVLDPESAHHWALEFAKRGWAPTYRPSVQEASIKPEVKLFSDNLIFGNCIGLAAGFDKDGEAIQPMLDMGFGSVEIGSVTPEPQPGNPKPRMFRLHQDYGIINRYGFNSMGADVVQEHLREYRAGPPVEDKEEESNTHIALQTVKTLGRGCISLLRSAPYEQVPGVVGVNLGKNKDGDEITDYERGIRQLGPFADYLVINVSSPNTPGLRDLQQPDPLKRLLEASIEARNQLPIRHRDNKPFLPPLLVKLAPDMDDEQLHQVLNTIVQSGIDGIVVTNTTLSRPDSLVSKHKTEVGGLSGAPVRDLSTECIRKVYTMTDGKIPIVGVGGVMSGHDAYEKLKAGASLVQIYSMMVYKGPGVVSQIRQELAELMLQNGQRRVEDVVGLDHEEIYWKKREEKLLEKRKHETVIQDDTPLSAFSRTNGTTTVWDDMATTQIIPACTEQDEINRQTDFDSENTQPESVPPLESNVDEE